MGNWIALTWPGLAKLLLSSFGGLVMFILSFGGGAIHGPQFLERLSQGMYGFLNDFFKTMTLNELSSIIIFGAIFFIPKFEEIIGSWRKLIRHFQQ